jgi:predicted nucleic acid-binding protein
LKRFVLDASVALAWFLDHPVSTYATEIRQLFVDGARAIVPALWHLEMANGLVVAERRKMIKSDDLSLSLIRLEELIIQAIETRSDFWSMRQAVNTARGFLLSAYDSVYLDTARAESVPLATLDKSLRAAAVRAGVELLR